MPTPGTKCAGPDDRADCFAVEERIVELVAADVSDFCGVMNEPKFDQGPKVSTALPSVPT